MKTENASTGKGKNDKIIYLYGNQLIALEKMDNEGSKYEQKKDPEGPFFIEPFQQQELVPIFD